MAKGNVWQRILHFINYLSFAQVNVFENEKLRQIFKPNREENGEWRSSQ